MAEAKPKYEIDPDYEFDWNAPAIDAQKRKLSPGLEVVGDLNDPGQIYRALQKGENAAVKLGLLKAYQAATAPINWVRPGTIPRYEDIQKELESQQVGTPIERGLSDLSQTAAILPLETAVGGTALRGVRGVAGAIEPYAPQVAKVATSAADFLAGKAGIEKDRIVSWPKALTSIGTNQGIINAITGEAFGQDPFWSATIGAALPVGFTGLSGIAQAIIRPFTRTFKEASVGKILDEFAHGVFPHWEEPPLPGLKPNIAQASDSPGYRSLVQSREADPKSAVKNTNIANWEHNNTIVADNIRSLGDAAADSAEAMHAAVVRNAERLRAAGSAAFKKLGIDIDTTAFPVTNDLRKTVADFMKSLTTSERRAIPKDLLNIPNEMPDSIPFKEVQTYSSTISGLARERAANTAESAILNRFAATIDNFETNMASSKAIEAMTGGKVNLADFNRAKALWAEYKNLTRPKGISAITKPNSTVKPSTVGNDFVHSREGGKEDLEAYLNLTRGDPVAEQAARDYFTKTFFETVESTKAIPGAATEAGKRAAEAAAAVPGATPETIAAAAQKAAEETARVISQPRVTKFIKDNEHVIKRLYNDDQQYLIQKIGDATDYLNKDKFKETAGGSDTFAKLSGGNFVEFLLGAQAQNIVRTAMNTAAVGSIPFLPWEGAITTLGAAALGNYAQKSILEMIYHAPKEQILRMLDDAIANPALAREYRAKVGDLNQSDIQAQIARLFGRGVVPGVVNLNRGEIPPEDMKDFWDRRMNWGLINAGP